MSSRYIPLRQVYHELPRRTCTSDITIRTLAARMAHPCIWARTCHGCGREVDLCHLDRTCAWRTNLRLAEERQRRFWPQERNVRFFVLYLPVNPKAVCQAQDEYVASDPELVALCRGRRFGLQLRACDVAEQYDSRPRMLDCMELEDRVLFSATPLAMAIGPHWGAASGHVHPLGPQAAPAHQHDPLPHVAGQNVLASQAETNVVLIDSQLADSAQLIADVAPGTKIFVYNSQTDSAAEVLQRIVAWADATGCRIEDLAILSHGVGGAFELGNQWITATLLSATAPAWQELSQVLARGRTLKSSAAMSRPQGPTARTCSNALASVTHASVFASTDSTGAGGNWQLEAASAGASPAALGASSVPLNTSLLASYDGTLGTIAVDTVSSAATASGGASSLTFSHTVNSGSDAILIVEVTAVHGGASDPVASVTYGGQSLTVLVRLTCPMPNPPISGTCWPPRSARPTSS